MTIALSLVLLVCGILALVPAMIVGLCLSLVDKDMGLYGGLVVFGFAFGSFIDSVGGSMEDKPPKG